MVKKYNLTTEEGEHIRYLNIPDDVEAQMAKLDGDIHIEELDPEMRKYIASICESIQQSISLPVETFGKYILEDKFVKYIFLEENAGRAAILTGIQRLIRSLSLKYLHNVDPSIITDKEGIGGILHSITEELFDELKALFKDMIHQEIVQSEVARQFKRFVEVKDEDK